MVYNSEEEKVNWGAKQVVNAMGNNINLVALISFKQLNIYSSLCPANGKLAGMGPCS